MGLTYKVFLIIVTAFLLLIFISHTASWYILMARLPYENAGGTLGGVHSNWNHQHASWYLFLTLLGTGILLGALVIGLLERYVVRRLRSLGLQVKELGEKKDFSSRVTVVGKDELSQLGHSINMMLSTLESNICERRLLNENLQKAEAELLQSQKMESMGRLAGGIAHDFNNILSGILGYTSLLLDQFKGDPNASKKLGIIKKSAERGAELTRSLLGFARKEKSQKKVFNVNDIITEVEALLSGSMDRKIRLKHYLASNLKSIEGDSTQISQVLMNLAINACDAMPEGGEVIVMSQNFTVEASDLPHYPELKVGSYVHLTFRDTGSGIPPEILSKVFDPFFTTKGSGKGSGLGLAMVYGIMKDHNGSISIESTVGVGTTIHLYFPVVTEVLAEEETTVSEAINPPPSKNILPSFILIADDEDILRELYQDMIFQISPETKLILARDGMEALQVFKQHAGEIELLLMDVIMPRMDGIKAFKEISKIRPGIKTIFVSGYAESASIASLREDGRVAFIQKPLEEEKLLSVIRSIMPNHGWSYLPQAMPEAAAMAD